jgi:hypothetical protein
VVPAGEIDDAIVALFRKEVGFILVDIGSLWITSIGLHKIPFQSTKCH